CKSRFPRESYDSTMINPDTGSIDMKKGESWLNTFNYVLTFLMRCNTDVACMLSGTAIKAIIQYVTDYITKTALNTHTMMDAMQTILTKTSEFLSGDDEDISSAR
ncbi:hypothetical protein FA95DRAFT_1462516, partial [Auriscalpium vulgare]